MVRTAAIPPARAPTMTNISTSAPTDNGERSSKPTSKTSKVRTATIAPMPSMKMLSI
jgi:hypothetical protein